MSEIWKMPASGGDAVQITRNAGDLPQESPDGKYLYYMKPVRYPEQCSVWRMPTEGGEETRVVDSTSCLGPYAVGEQGIYYVTPRDKQGRSEINLWDFRTGKTRKILALEQPSSRYIAVSPHSRTLLYTQDDQLGRDPAATSPSPSTAATNRFMNGMVILL